MEKNTVREYKRVSEAIKSDIRMADLSFGHHQQVASLPPAKQEQYLNKAVEEKLSVRDLREEIRKVFKPSLILQPFFQ